MILEGATYEQVPGDVREPAPVLYALSTCGFCRRAVEHLKNKGVGFRYLYFDKLQPDEKERVRQMIRRLNPGAILFPVLFLSGDRVLVGYQQHEWDRALR